MPFSNSILRSEVFHVMNALTLGLLGIKKIAHNALDKNFRDNCVKLEAKAKQSMIKSARDRRMKVCAKNADKIDLPTQLFSFSGP